MRTEAVMRTENAVGTGAVIQVEGGLPAEGWAR